MTAPRHLYLNRCDGATITSSAEDSGYPDDNAATWKEYDQWGASGANSYWWKADAGSGVTANSVALGGHNLNTVGARFKVDGSNNDADWTAVQAYVTPPDDFAIARCFTQVTWRYWRFTVDNNGGANFIPKVGIFFAGDYLEMEHSPDSMGLDPDRQEDVGRRLYGETGYLLGSITDWTKRISTWNYRYLTQSWIEDTWRPYWDDYRNQKFFFSWDYSGHQTEVYLVSFAGPARWNSPYEGIRRHLTYELIGRKEE